MSTNAISGYYDKAAIARAAEAGQHRNVIGGLWDEIGSLQFDFMVSRGLRPQHRLLDIGCGSLRGGVRFVPYLEPGNYYGLDINQPLLDAGYEKEIVPAGLAERLPRDHLIAEEKFDFAKLPGQFDRALAVSVFTHLTFNLIRVCLERLAPSMSVGGEFYATYFLAPDHHPTHSTLTHEQGGVVTHGDKDPYHYRVADLRHAVAGLPWRFEHIGDFGHPRGQQMALFRRVKTTSRWRFW